MLLNPLRVSFRGLDAPRQRARAISRARDAVSLVWEALAFFPDGAVDAAVLSSVLAAARLPATPLPNGKARRKALEALSKAAAVVTKLLAAAGARDAGPLFVRREPPCAAAADEAAATPEQQPQQPAGVCLVRLLAAAASSSPPVGEGQGEGAAAPSPRRRRRRRTELLLDLILAAGLALCTRDPDAGAYVQGWRWGPEDLGSDDRDADLATPLARLALGVARALAVVAEQEGEGGEACCFSCPYCGSSSSAATTTTTTATAAAAAAARESLAAVFRSRRACFAIWTLCSSHDGALMGAPLMVALARAGSRAHAAGRAYPGARRFTSDADSLAGSDEDRSAAGHAADARLATRAAARMAMVLSMAGVSGLGGGGGGGGNDDDGAAGLLGGSREGVMLAMFRNPQRFARTLAATAASDPAAAAAFVRNFNLRQARGDDGDGGGGGGGKSDDDGGEEEEEAEEEVEDEDEEEEDGEAVAEEQVDAAFDLCLFFAPDADEDRTAAESRAITGAFEGKRARCGPLPPPGHPFSAFYPLLPTGEGCLIALGEEALVRTVRPIVDPAEPEGASSGAATAAATPAMVVVDLRTTKDGDDGGGQAPPPPPPPPPPLRWTGPPLGPSFSLDSLAHHVARFAAEGDPTGFVSTPLSGVLAGREDFVVGLADVAAGRAVSVDALPPVFAERGVPGSARWTEALFPAAAAARQSADAAALVARAAPLCDAAAAGTLLRYCSGPLVGALLFGGKAEGGPDAWAALARGEPELAAVGRQAFGLRAAALATLFSGRTPATGARRAALSQLVGRMGGLSKGIAAGAGALRRRVLGSPCGGAEEEEDGEEEDDEDAATAMARCALGAAVTIFALGGRLAPVAEGCPPLFQASGGVGAAAAATAVGGRPTPVGIMIEALGTRPPGAGQRQQQRQQEDAGPSAAQADGGDEGAAAAASAICALKAQQPPAPPDPAPTTVLDLLCSAIADAVLLLPARTRRTLLAPAADAGASLPRVFATLTSSDEGDDDDDDDDDDGDGDVDGRGARHCKRRPEDDEAARQAMRHPREAGDADVLGRADALASEVEAGLRRGLRRLEDGAGAGARRGDAAGPRSSWAARGGGGKARKMEREGGGDDGDDGKGGPPLDWSCDDGDDGRAADNALAVASGRAALARANVLINLGAGLASLDDDGAAEIGAGADARRVRVRGYMAAAVFPAARLLVTHCACAGPGSPLSARSSARVAGALSSAGALPAIAFLIVTTRWRWDAAAAPAAAAPNAAAAAATSVGACGFFSAPAEHAALLKPLAAFDAPGPACVALLSLLERAFAPPDADPDAWLTPDGRRRRRRRQPAAAAAEAAVDGGGGGGGKDDDEAAAAEEEEEEEGGDAGGNGHPLNITDLQGERTVLLALFHILDGPPLDGGWARHVQGACARVVSVLLRRHCEAAVLRAEAADAASAPGAAPPHLDPRLSPAPQAPSLLEAARWCARALRLLRGMSDELLRVKMSRSLSAEALQADVAEARVALARCLLRVEGARRAGGQQQRQQAPMETD